MKVSISIHLKVFLHRRLAKIETTLEWLNYFYLNTIKTINERHAKFAEICFVCKIMQMLAVLLLIIKCSPWYTRYDSFGQVFRPHLTYTTPPPWRPGGPAWPVAPGIPGGPASPLAPKLQQKQILSVLAQLIY